MILIQRRQHFSLRSPKKYQMSDLRVLKLQRPFLTSDTYRFYKQQVSTFMTLCNNVKSCQSHLTALFKIRCLTLYPRASCHTRFQITVETPFHFRHSEYACFASVPNKMLALKLLSVVLTYCLLVIDYSLPLEPKLSPNKILTKRMQVM